MTYETAAYLKLMLHGGLKEAYLCLLDDMLDGEPILEGILLELSEADDDTEKAISCLKQFLSGQRVDYDFVAERLRLLMLGLFNEGVMNQSEVVSALCCMAENSGFETVEPWHSMRTMENYYCVAVQGDLDADRFNDAFYAFLADRVPFFNQISGANGEWKRIVSRRLEDQRRMTRVGFFLNHIAPYLDLGLFLAVLAAAAALLEADAIRNQGIVILLVGIYVFVTVAFLALGPLTRAGRLDSELKRLQLDVAPENTKEHYEYHLNGQTILFDREGMTVDEAFFRLENLEAEMDTSGKHAVVSLRITLRTKSGRIFQIPLCPDSLAMLERFEIKLDNRSDLDYLLGNRREAMKDILRFGAVWPDRRNRR